MDAIERRRRATAEAADWVVRLETSDLPRETREQFIDWLRESSIHVAEMLRMAELHGALEQFERWTRITTDGPKEDTTVIPLSALEEKKEDLAPMMWAQARQDRPRVVGKRRKEVWRIALATTVVAVVVATVILLPGLRGQVIDRERGERREVTLADGSLVQVDPETRLRVKFAERWRRVYLEHGRVLFRVAKNPNRPFLVQADDTIVRAVGTAFAVERQRGGLIVTVAEGKVAVVRSEIPNTLFRSGKASPRASAPPGLQGKAFRQEAAMGTQAEVLLVANQQVTVDGSGATEPVRNVDSRRELAWAEGHLIFQDDTVITIVETFNRYNLVQLHVTDTTLASRPVSGVFSASDPESFVAFIQTVAPVRVLRRDDENIVISSASAR